MIFVAASDASLKSKSQADFLANGIDDQEEINAAIIQARLLGIGGKVALSEGTFSTSAPIIMGERIALTGAGWSTRIIVAESSPYAQDVIKVNCDYVALADMVVDANGLFGSAVHITRRDPATNLFLPMSHINLTRLHIRNGTDDTLGLEGLVNHVRVRDCFVEVLALTAGSASAIEIDDGADDVLIEGCQVYFVRPEYFNGAIVVTFHPGAQEPRNIRIIGNYIEVGGRGGSPPDGIFNFFPGAVVIGNIVKVPPPPEGEAPWWANGITLGEDGIAQGNHVYVNAYSGIRARRGCIVIGNRVVDTSSDLHLIPILMEYPLEAVEAHNLVGPLNR